MATVTIPAPATQQEVRVDTLILRNNLNEHLPEFPALPTDEQVIAKFGGSQMDRMLEPQDATGKQVGERIRVSPTAPLPLADILTRTYQRPDGSTFSGRQMMWDIQIMADFHKAEGLAP